MARRLASLALMAAVGCAGGCAASRNMGRIQPPPPLAQKSAVSPAVAQIVDRHNKNAELVTSLEATPSVSAKISRMGGGGRGNMVFERDHNFRFVVEGGMSGKHFADIGSNDDEFWFWTDDKQDRHVYVGRYDSVAKAGGTELVFQPEWIVEALGLYVIPQGEEQQIRVVNNDREAPGTDAWVHPRQTLRREAVKKVTIVDRATGQTLEHRFFAPGIARPVAVAKPQGTTEVATSKEEGAGRVRLPQKIHLQLAPADSRQSPVEMDLVLGGVKVNNPIAEARREELFTVPQIAGSPIVRLDESTDRARLDPGASRARGRQEIRQSAPVPPAGEGVRLGEPAPIGTDGAYLRRSDPMPLSPDLGGESSDTSASSVLGPSMPQPPENPAERVSQRYPMRQY